ncbi:MAG: ABC transporter permease [Clostridia bacterium]|nr:ABC transporter permease [Clostridia bacterium]
MNKNPATVMNKVGKTVLPYAGVIILVVIACVSTKTFATAFNIRNLISQCSILMIAAIGSSFVMAHGNLDFSNGGTMAICLIFALALCKNAPMWAILPLCLIAGTAMGALIGFLVTKVRIMAFIVGMCLMRLSSALLYTTTQMGTYILPVTVTTSLDKPVVYAVAALVMCALGIVVFEFTKIGQHNKLIGANPIAAKLSGINVKRYQFFAFVAAGICAGAAAFLLAIRSGGLSNKMGSYEIDVLIALTIGGMPLTGGSSASVRSAIIGALSLTVLNNILVLWGVGTEFVNVIKGIIFLSLVLISSRKKTGVINR